MIKNDDVIGSVTWPCAIYGLETNFWKLLEDLKIENYFTNETSFLKETCIPLTGATKNSGGLSIDSFIKVWPGFKMSYLYMPRISRGCEFDLKMPLSQSLHWFCRYEKGSFRMEWALHICRAKGALPSWKIDA